MYIISSLYHNNNTTYLLHYSIVNTLPLISVCTDTSGLAKRAGSRENGEYL